MKILVAEDDKVSRMTLAACLRGWGYEVISVADGLAAFEWLEKTHGPRLAVLDWEMPGLDGIEVCAKLRAITDLPFRYLIVLTGRDREEDIVAALEKGADDYITKPWTPGELRARLGVGQRMVRLYEQLEETSLRLALAAQTDGLTEIWNRSAIMSRLNEESARAARGGTPLSLFMLDVDHFKRVNDTYGHQVGDQVLKEVARLLRDTCRRYDNMGRYGGEEFLIVVPDVSYGETETFAQRFRQLIAVTPIYADGTRVPVTVSIGAVWLAPEQSGDMGSLIKAADCMLYRAKEFGRNRVETCMFGQGPNAIEKNRQNEGCTL